MQTLVEIGPSNTSQGQQVLSSVLSWRSVGRSNFDKGLHNLTMLIQKRHILMRTSVLFNGINSGQLLRKKNTK